MKYISILINLALLQTLTFSGCGNAHKKKEKVQIHNVGKSSVVKTVEDNLDWEVIIKNNPTVEYIQLNFNSVANATSISNDIIAFKDSSKYFHYTLDKKEMHDLVEIILNEDNFANGECGTFNLNAGFIIYQNHQIVATVDIGCGFNQWNFKPYNKYAKGGSLSQKGLSKMQRLLDTINKTSRK